MQEKLKENTKFFQDKETKYTSEIEQLRLDNVFLKQKSQKMKEYEVSKLKMGKRIESLQWKKDDMEKQVEKLKENHQKEVEEWRNKTKSLSFTISTLEETTAKQTEELIQRWINFLKKKRICR